MSNASQDPQAVRLLEEENELLRANLRQVQAELEHYFLLNRENEAKLASKARPAPATTAVLAAAPVMGAPKINPLFKITDFLRLTVRTRTETLRASGFFDEAWYLQQYPDVAREGKDPIEHYLRRGAAMGLDPSPHFDTRWYRENYPDVARAGFNPLLHYIRCGRAEARLPRQGAKPGADISAYGRAMEDLSELAATQAKEIDRLERELEQMREEQSRRLAESASTGAGLGRQVAWSKGNRRWQGVRAARKERVGAGEARDGAGAIIDRAPEPDRVIDPAAG